jgi:hypothetical protein
VIDESGAAGFSTRSYRKVYGSYSSILEEVLSEKRVPPYYRQLTKRYFQLIHPRSR